MKKFLTAILVLLGFTITVAPAFAAAPSNGSFEVGTDPGVFTTLNPGDTNMSNWTVNAGSVDFIGSYWTASDGIRSVDLNGLTTGSISQTFDTQKDTKYKVTFVMSGNPDSRESQNDPYWSPSVKKVRVSATGDAASDYTFDTSVKHNSLSNMMWESHTYTFKAKSKSTTLTFASQIPGAFGPAIDNIVVEKIKDKDDCKKDGWRDFDEHFKNQGRCVSSFEHDEHDNHDEHDGHDGHEDDWKLIDTLTVLSNSTDGVNSTNPLTSGKKYKFEASGTWTNTPHNVADAEFASIDNWTNHFDGYNIDPYFLGEGEFDLQVNNGFVNWGAYSVSHVYNLPFTGTGSVVNFRIFDGDSNSGPTAIQPGWYGDNTGSLTVKIYQKD